MRISKFLFRFLTVFSVMFFAGCSSDNDSGGNSNPDNGGDNGGGGSGRYVWLISNGRTYVVNNGVASNVVSSESNTNWISYVDNRHFQNTFTFTSTTTGVITGMSSEINQTRNGNTSTQSSAGTTRDAQGNIITSTGTTTIIFDDGSGLILSMRTNGTQSLNGGAPTNTNSETNYAIQLLSAESNIRTYRRSNTSTGSYSVIRKQNGITLESRSYSAEGVLLSTSTYSFPNNATIRTKLPEFTLRRYTSETRPESNTYQTCEVISDSNTELVIRVKTYRADGVLSRQADHTYLRRNL